jgi:hypothetical protein
MNRDTLFQVTKFLNKKELVTYISSNKLFNGYFNCYKVYIMFHIFGNEIIKKVINRWSFEDLKLLFNIKDFDITYGNNFAIRDASENGHLDVVKYLYENTKADPIAMDNFAIKWAADNGHLNVVKYLHENTKADLTADDDYTIEWASIIGHLDIVKYLCENTEVDHMDMDMVNGAIQLAIIYGHMDVVKYLREIFKVI